MCMSVMHVSLCLLRAPLCVCPTCTTHTPTHPLPKTLWTRLPLTAPNQLPMVTFNINPLAQLAHPFTRTTRIMCYLCVHAQNADKTTCENCLSEGCCMPDDVGGCFDPWVCDDGKGDWIVKELFCDTCATYIDPLNGTRIHTPLPMPTPYHRSTLSPIHTIIHTHPSNNECPSTRSRTHTLTLTGIPTFTTHALTHPYIRHPWTTQTS